VRIEPSDAAQEAHAAREEPAQTADVGFEASSGACPICGGPVKPQKVRRGEPKVYCSRRCARVAYHRAHPRQRLELAPPPAAPPTPPPPKRRRRAVGRRIEAVLQDPVAIAALERLVERHGNVRAALELALRYAIDG
jgi:hypothetical protein